MIALTVAITVSDAERVVLERQAATLLAYRDGQRATVILDALEGLSVVEIAERVERCSEVVVQWR